jgi:hypothetical protein
VRAGLRHQIVVHVSLSLIPEVGTCWEKFSSSAAALPALCMLQAVHLWVRRAMGGARHPLGDGATGAPPYSRRVGLYRSCAWWPRRSLHRVRVVAAAVGGPRRRRRQRVI